MNKDSLSESRVLIAPGARLNWRPGSIARFESLWSILHKLVYLNDVNVKELTFALNPWQFWRAQKAKPVSISLLDFGSLSRRRLQWLLGLRSETLDYAVVAPYVVPLETRNPIETATNVLRFCRVCLERGFHTPLFQELSIVACPIHHVPLEEKCWHCRSEIRYEFDGAAAHNPYGCSKCQTLFWGGIRKAFWSPGLNDEESGAIERYIKWRNDVANDPGIHFWNHAVHEPTMTTKVFGYIHSVQPLSGWDACWRRNAEEVRGTVMSGSGIPSMPVVVNESSRRPSLYGEFFKLPSMYEPLEPVVRPYYGIFKSVRRYLKRRFLVRHDRCRLLANTFGLEHRARCPWVTAYYLWCCEWEGRSLYAEERFEHWRKTLQSQSGYLRELMSMVDPGDRRAEEPRQVWSWIGSRWLVARLLVSFYEQLRLCGAIKLKADSISDPCLHWQPATGSSGHVLMWWSVPVLNRIDANMPSKKDHQPEIGEYRKEITKASEYAKRFGPWF